MRWWRRRERWGDEVCMQGEYQCVKLWVLRLSCGQNKPNPRLAQSPTLQRQHTGIFASPIFIWHVLASLGSQPLIPRTFKLSCSVLQVSTHYAPQCVIILLCRICPQVTCPVAWCLRWVGKLPFHIYDSIARLELMISSQCTVAGVL